MDHISMHKQNLIKIHSLFLKIEILTPIKGHNFVEKFRKISCASHNTAYSSFIKILQFVLKILNGNKTLTSIKGHNFVENERKILFNHPNLHLVNINAYTKFDRNPQINSQDIEHKQNSDVDQGP